MYVLSKRLQWNSFFNFHGNKLRSFLMGWLKTGQICNSFRLNLLVFLTTSKILIGSESFHNRWKYKKYFEQSVNWTKNCIFQNIFKVDGLRIIQKTDIYLLILNITSSVESHFWTLYRNFRGWFVSCTYIA